MYSPLYLCRCAGLFHAHNRAQFTTRRIVRRHCRSRQQNNRNVPQAVARLHDSAEIEPRESPPSDSATSTSGVSLRSTSSACPAVATNST